ncbi:MAG: serine hydrolase, partial [Steroidobacteraceae bacterium]|nr:serine hydrolase [Steroidobacteraceae bacterium]
MRVTLSRCGWLLLLFGVVAPVQATDTRFDAVDASVDALVAEHHLGGAVLLLAQDGVVVHQKAYGSYALDTRVPVASASKWMSA